MQLWRLRFQEIGKEETCYFFTEKEIAFNNFDCQRMIRGFETAKTGYVVLEEMKERDGYQVFCAVAVAYGEGAKCVPIEQLRYKSVEEILHNIATG